MGDYGHDLVFGVFIDPAARSADQVVALSVLAEEAGYDLVSYTDHPYSPRALDALALMSFVAARTGGVRLAGNVLSLPLRPPAGLAQAVASLDILSRGRAELGIGAGSAWDAIEAMGGRRLDRGDSVEALEEAIHVIRELWDAGAQGGVTFEGKYYGLAGALRGPAPVHDIGIWVGAFKPRMLRLVGRLADGWWPTVAALKPGDLTAGNAMIDAAAAQAGREPPAIRRLLKLGAVDAPARETAAQLARLALEDGIGTFIVTANDPGAIAAFASEVAPRVREAVQEARLRGPAAAPAALVAAAAGSSAPREAEEAAPGETEDERLGGRPTPAGTSRLSGRGRQRSAHGGGGAGDRRDRGRAVAGEAAAGRSDPPQRPGPLGRFDAAAAGPPGTGGALHRPGTPRLEAADRGARPAPGRAVGPTAHPAAGTRRGYPGRGGQSGAQRDGVAPERLDAGHGLLPLLQHRGAAPRRRGRSHVSAPGAQRTAAHTSDRPADRGAPGDPRRDPGGPPRPRQSK